jgi:hypothetical protein
VRAVAGVADQDEATVGEPPQQQPHQPAQQLRRRAVRPATLAILLGGAVQINQHRQGPQPGGEREADQHGQDDPLMAVTPSGEGVAGAYRVAVPGLAIDLLALMAIDGVVADEGDGSGGEPVADEEARRMGSRNQLPYYQPGGPQNLHQSS